MSPGRCAVLFIAFCAASAPVRASQPTHCEDLRPDLGVLGFQPRINGDRCEGFYRSNVSTQALSLAFLMAGRLPSGLDPVNLLAAHAGEVNVRAVALPLGTYYRMDAKVDGANGLHWPLSEVIGRSESLSPGDLGIYGWFQSGDEIQYTPVRAVDGAGKDLGDEPVRLGVRSNVPLDRLLYRLTTGNDCKASREQKWVTLASDVRPGEVLSLKLPPGQRALCYSFRARLSGSDDWDTLTVPVVQR